MHLEQSKCKFQTTSWSELCELAQRSAGQKREALNTLVARYWPPVYAYLRKNGLDREQAAELTQDYFVEVVLERDLFAKASRDRGRLRTLLLVALKNYRVDRHRRGVVRGSCMTFTLNDLDLEETRIHNSQLEKENAINTFDRRWALALFEEALGRCEKHFLGCGKANHWLIFKRRIIEPAINDNELRPLRELIEELGIETPAMASAALQVVKKRFIMILRDVVGETIAEDQDLDLELGEVRRALGV